MVTLHPEILSRDGKNLFAVLPYEEFEMVQELLEELEFLRDHANESSASSPSNAQDWDEVAKLFDV